MDTIELKAATRTTTGNNPAKAMRRQGLVPAVLYGPKSEPVKLSIQAFDLDTIVKKGGLSLTVINLAIDDATTSRPVMIKELQTHPVSRALLHVDLYEVSMDRKIYVNVPVTVTGKSVGVENGGVLQIVRRELEVYCLPHKIPGHIEIDITQLDIGDSVHVEDLPLSEDIEIPHDVNFTVLTVSSTRREVEAAAGAEEGAGAAEGGSEA